MTGAGTGPVPSRAQVAAVMDATLLKPEASHADVDALVADAARLGCGAVCVSPSMLPLRDVHSALWRRRPEDAGPGGGAARLDALYADLLDHILRVTEWTESLRDMIATVFETHLSLQDQRLNEVMRRLAGWAAVVSVPTLATGWFGMNVPYPGQSNPLGLVLAVLTVVVPAATIWWALRRRGWL